MTEGGHEGVAVEAKDQVLPHENRAADNVPAAELARFAAVLDDLRHLGELDLQLNHARRATPRERRPK